MKYQNGDIVRHRYDKQRADYFGYGFIQSIDQNELIIFYSKSKKTLPNIYPKSYVYSLDIITSIFREID